MLKLPFPDRREATPQTAKEFARHGQEALAIFRLGSELLAVDASAMQEITLMARLSTPGGLPSVLAGFLNLANRPIPVIRLHRLLGLAEPVYGLYTQILILRDHDGNSVGWIVDRVVNVITVRASEIMPIPENQCFKECAKGTFIFDGMDVSILAPDCVLLEKERQRISEFRDKEEERLRDLELSGS